MKTIKSSKFIHGTILYRLKKFVSVDIFNLFIFRFIQVKFHFNSFSFSSTYHMSRNYFNTKSELKIESFIPTYNLIKKKIYIYFETLNRTSCMFISNLHKLYVINVTIKQKWTLRKIKIIFLNQITNIQLRWTYRSSKTIRYLLKYNNMNKLYF